MAIVDQNLSKAEKKALKAQKRAEKELNKLKKEQSKNPKTDVPLTVLCVRFGNKYGIDYVEKLRNMVSRNLTIPYEFVCLTDDPKPIDGVRIIWQANSGYSKGWWHKVHMFDPSLPLSGRILYFDLDVIIFNNINKLAEYKIDDFVGIRDFNRKFHHSWKNLNSSVLAWNAGTNKKLWEEFQNNSTRALRLHGDQDYIWRETRGTIKFFPDEWIQSYKWEIRRKQDLEMYKGKRRFKTVKNDVIIDPSCSVVVFHGEPNPENINDKFVLDNWK